MFTLEVCLISSVICDKNNTHWKRTNSHYYSTSWWVCSQRLLVSAAVVTSVSTLPSLLLLQSTLCSLGWWWSPRRTQICSPPVQWHQIWPFECVCHPLLFHKSDQLDLIRWVGRLDWCKNSHHNILPQLVPGWWTGMVLESQQNCCLLEFYPPVVLQKGTEIFGKLLYWHIWQWQIFCIKEHPVVSCMGLECSEFVCLWRTVFQQVIYIIFDSGRCFASKNIL